MFVELKKRIYYRSGYVSVNAMFAIDNISRVIECADDYTCTNVITKDGKLHTINEKYTDVIKKIQNVMQKGKGE